MNETHPTGRDAAMALQDGGTMAAFLVDCMEDQALRAQAVSDPVGTLAERGIALPEGMDVRMIANSDDTFHFVLPPDPNAVLEDEALAGIAGGSTFGTLSSVSTFPSCLGTGGTASTSEIQRSCH